MPRSASTSESVVKNNGNHRKITGKSWENHGKMQKKWDAWCFIGFRE
jgi:hypothetical protein